MKTVQVDVLGWGGEKEERAGNRVGRGRLYVRLTEGLKLGLNLCLSRYWINRLATSAPSHRSA